MRSILNRTLALALALIMALSLAACGGSSNESAATGGQTKESGEKAVNTEKDSIVFVVNVAEPGSYNQWTNGGTPGARATLYAIMESLIHSDGHGGWTYVLATGYEMESDLSVLLHLRDNVYFHNGEKMTADDVILSTDLAINAVGGGTQYNCIKSVEKVDDLTVRFNLNYQSSLFNNCLAGISVTSKKYFDEVGHEGFALNPIGTGYYMWDKDGYVNGDTVVCKAFDQYWGEHGTIKTLTFRFITETSQALIELENGKVDVINANGSTLTSLQGNDKFNTVVVNDYVAEYLGFNLNSEKVKDIRVREAIAHAIDREDINIGAREGMCEVIDNFITPAHGDKYNPETADYYAFDPDKTREIMTELGFSETNKLHLKLMTDTQNARRLEAQQIKSMLDKCYFDIELANLEAAAFNDVLMGGDPEWYDMLIRGIGVPVSEPFQQALTILSIDATDAKTNPMQLKADSHPKAQEYNDKINEVLTKMNVEDQVPLAREIQLLDREICETVWLFNRMEYYAVRADLHLVWDEYSMTLDTTNAYYTD